MVGYDTGGVATAVTSIAGLPVAVTGGGDATAANQTSQTTILSDIQTSVQLLDNAIAGNELQVDIVSGAVTASGSLSLTSATTGGYTGYGNIDLDETKVAIKAAAGTLGFIYAANLTAADLFIKFWDVASGSVTVGTTAATYVFSIPTSTGGKTGVMVPIPVGLNFATAITAACLTGVATSSSAGPATNGCVVVIGYK